MQWIDKKTGQNSFHINYTVMSIKENTLLALETVWDGNNKVQGAKQVVLNKWYNKQESGKNCIFSHTFF